MRISSLFATRGACCLFLVLTLFGLDPAGFALNRASAAGMQTFDYTGAVQTFIVPPGVTAVHIDASGAQGGGSSFGTAGGLGAQMTGNFAVTPGQTLSVVVGQQGLLQVGGDPQNSSGGGGGTFVYDESGPSLLVAAGGGGGKCNFNGSSPLHLGADGQITTSGGASSDGNPGGTGGNGGPAGLFGSPCAGGGAGWLSAGGGPFGGASFPTWTGGPGFGGGGGGGTGGVGGFGGGGGGGNHYGGGGGGGGYSGGGGGTDPTHGGGGGSFSLGSNQLNTAGFKAGNGQVIIAWGGRFTSLYAKGDAVPGAGTVPAIQTGSLWTGFGAPAINDSGAVAYLGKWKAPAVTTPSVLPVQYGTGIFVSDTLVVKAGDAVPGAGTGSLPANATFKSFKDPVLDNGGHVAFLAAINDAGVLSTNDVVVVSNGRTGTLEVLAREGDAAVGTSDAIFKSFTSVSLEGTSVGATIFTASLLAGTGTPAVTSASDTGAWWLPSGGSSVVKLVRDGDSFGAETIKSFLLLKTISGSPGHGRGQIDGDGALLQLSLTGGATARQVQALAEPGTLTEYAGTGDTLGSSTLTTATWSKMNLPSSGNSGANISVLGALTAYTGGITSGNAKGIFLSADNGTTWEPLVRQTDAAPGMGASALFSGLKDPVNSSSSAAVAFRGTAKGGSVVAGDNDGIWFSPDGVALELIAREGALPPDAPAGAQWKTFSSLALPGGNLGPVFTASLFKGTAAVPHPSGITSIDDFALYAVDSGGTLLELIRENKTLPIRQGQTVLTNTVKSFKILKAASGSAGVTRAFNANGQLILLVTYVDGIKAIVRVDLP